MKERRITRREFIEKTPFAAASATALPGLLAAEADAASKPALPRRVLGRTGVEVPILAFGCGSRFLMYQDEAEAQRILNRVIDLGITYLDTAAAYGNGQSETRLGSVMKSRRQEVWLATKVPSSARTREAALREVEKSLKRLQTDRLDLLHLHSLTNDDDLAKIEAPQGALKALYQLRDEKVTRFIGMSSHTDGAVMARAIERHDLDCVQMAMNPSQANDFEKLALPAARKKNLGVILMKVTSQEKLLGAGAGKADIDALIRYALSLPVATAVMGMPKPQFIEHNLAVARAFHPLTTSEMDRLRRQLAPARTSVEDFFRHHQDGTWA